MKPRFTLAILYIFGFFFLYCFVLIAPALWEVLHTTPVGPEQEELAAVAAKQAIQSKLWIAIVAAVAIINIWVIPAL